MIFIQAKELQSIYSELKSQYIPFSIAYKLMQLNELAEKCINFNETQYQNIISKFAQREADGQVAVNENGDIKIIPEKVQEVQKLVAEINSFDIEVPKADMLTIEELSRLGENLRLSMENLQKLYPFTLNSTE